jgi:hypothetical protein
LSQYRLISSDIPDIGIGTFDIGIGIGYVSRIGIDISIGITVTLADAVNNRYH